MELVTQLANHSSDTFNQTFFVWAYFFSVYAYAVDLRFILFIIHTHQAMDSFGYSEKRRL
jgi:hypothetical protein